MKKARVAEIKKANQFNNKQITEVFHQVMDHQMTMPFKIRWRIALRILKGGKEKLKIDIC